MGIPFRDQSMLHTVLSQVKAEDENTASAAYEPFHLFYVLLIVVI